MAAAEAASSLRTVKLRYLNSRHRHADTTKAAERPTFTQATRDEVTEEHMVRVGDGRAAFRPAAFDCDAGEAAEARAMFERRGFALVRLRSAVPEDELLTIKNPGVYRTRPAPARDGSYGSQKEYSAAEVRTREAYFRECEALARRVTGASHAATLTWAVRDGGKGKEKKGYLTAYATFAHCDFTDEIARGAPVMMAKRVPGLGAEAAAEYDYSFVNLWKPTARAVEQHPLAVLDYSTVSPGETKTVTLGYAVTPTKRAEKVVEEHSEVETAGVAAPAPGGGRKTGYYTPQIQQIVRGAGHKWYYYPNQAPDEALIFTQLDTRADADPRRYAKHGFHTSFWDPSGPQADYNRRSSVEVRVLCAFPKRRPATL